MKRTIVVLLSFFVVVLQGCNEIQSKNTASNSNEKSLLGAEQSFEVTENDSYVLFKINEDIQLSLKSILYTYKINKNQIQVLDRESNRIIATARLLKTNKPISGTIERLASNKLKLIKNYKGIQLELDVLDELKCIELVKDNAISNLQIIDSVVSEGNLIITAKSYTGEREENVLVRINDIPLAANPDLPKVQQDNRALKPFMVSDHLLMVKKLNSNLSSQRYEILDSINIDNYVSEDFNVVYSFSSMDEKYNKLTFTVENLKEDKAFIISNPFESLKLNSCLGISKLVNYQAKRIGNKLITEFSYLKNKSYSCLENDFQGVVYVIDSNLRSLKVNFN